MIRYVTVLFSIFLLMGIIHEGNAQSLHSIDNKLTDCLQENYSSDGMTRCTDNARSSWEQELDKYYDGLQGVLDSDAKSKLRSAQQDWEDFRDAEFDMIDEMSDMLKEDGSGGSMYSLVAATQKLNIIKARALVLKEYYDYVVSQGR